MIIVKNSQLNNDTIQSLNSLIEMDINAVSAFKLTRIIKELSSIIEDKIKMEKKILDKWVERDSDGNPTQPTDVDGKIIEGSVSISNIDLFTQEMNDLLNIENKIGFDKIKFEELCLSTAKIKDLLKLEFLFE